MHHFVLFSLGMDFTPKTYEVRNTAFESLFRSIEADFSGYSLQRRESLGLLEAYVELFLSGKKKTTVRYKKGALDCPAKAELDLFQTKAETLRTTRYIGRVLVDRITIKRFNQLDYQDARNDGFATRGDLGFALERIYGEIKPNDPVTIYWIHLLS